MIGYHKWERLSVPPISPTGLVNKFLVDMVHDTVAEQRAAIIAAMKPILPNRPVFLLEETIEVMDQPNHWIKIAYPEAKIWFFHNFTAER